MARDPWLTVEGLPNVRDVGGIELASGARVRHGRMIRSGTPGQMTPAGAAHAAEALGIRTQLDLRSLGEIKSGGAGPLVDRPDVDHVVINMGEDPQDRGLEQFVDEPDPLLTIYLTMLAQSHVAMQRAFLALVDAIDRPVLVHCHAGQDRTGLLVATVLDLLGADEQAIVDDYLLTLTWLRSRPADEQARRHEAIASLGMAPTALDPSEDAIRAYIGAMRETHGGGEGLLLELGLSDDHVARLRRELVDA